MAVQVPTPDQLRDAADEMGLSLTDQDVESFINILRPSIGAYNAVDLMADNLPPVRYPRSPGRQPSEGAAREEVIEKALNMISNTAPFDITHHPAMAIPCGLSDGLPVSVMLIGRHFDEPAIYRAAHAFEQSADWTAM